MIKKIIVGTIILISSLKIDGQLRYERFTLDDVIRIARDQSPDAILARHRFRASYWSFRSFRANYLPSLNVSGSLPNFDRSITWNTTTQDIVEANSITNLGRLFLSQNIGLTGGNISLSSQLQQINILGSDGYTHYLSTPISIQYSQPLFAFNGMKWERKIQPMLYDEAKKNYLDALEQVSLRAVGRFFDLALAELNVRIAKLNFSNSDTLYKIAQGRYNIGTIAENDVLQMQLSYLNAKTSLNQAEIDLANQKARLRSYLGYNDKIDFELILPDSIPDIKLEYQKVMDLAMQNNPDVMSWKRRSLESERDVAQAKGNRRNINLDVSYGKIHKEAAALPEVYQKPFNDQQGFEVSLRVPILDWGRGKGTVKMAESNEELVNVQLQQEQSDFEQNVFLQVMQFNLQFDQVHIAAISDTIGQKRYDVTKQRFLIGRIDVLNLNDALKEKDSAKRGYISSLRGYWNYFYTLRQLTLFDFLDNKPLGEDFDQLIE